MHIARSTTHDRPAGAARAVLLILLVLGVWPTAALAQDEPPDGPPDGPPPGPPGQPFELEAPANRRPPPDPGVLPAATTPVEAALAWSSLHADGGAPTILLARDDVFADPATSGGLQGLLDAPLLLTAGDGLDPAVEAELQRLGATTVIVLGGSEAISSSVADRLVELGITVERISGATRILTAIEIARERFADAAHAFLIRADGPEATQAWADALPAGAAAARYDSPTLMTATDGLSADTAAYLADSQITMVTIIGGPEAVSPAVEETLAALGIAVRRLGGFDRADTAVTAGVSAFPFGPERVLLVDGYTAQGWASGFAAAAHAESASIVLVDGDHIPTPSISMAASPEPVLCGPFVTATGCERANIVASIDTTSTEGTIFTTLATDTVPGDGGPDGVTGDGFLDPTAAPDAFCYGFVLNEFSTELTGAEIRLAAPADEAAAVLTLTTTPVAPGAPFYLGCQFDADEAAVAALFAEPTTHSLLLRDATHPDGLAGGRYSYTVDLRIGFADPGQVVGGSEADGGGFHQLFTDRDAPEGFAPRLCGFTGGMLVDDVVTAITLHRGPESVDGEAVLELPVPRVETVSYCLDVEGDLLTELADPEMAFYVQWTSEGQPDGALRAQLVQDLGPPPPPAYAAW